MSNMIKYKEYSISDLMIKGGLRRGPFGGALKKEIFVPEGYKVYQQMNVIRNNFDLGNYYIPGKIFINLEMFDVRPNDILISCSGTVGKVVLVPTNVKKGVINQALLRFRVSEDIVLPKYLWFLLNSDELQHKLTGMVHGSALKNIIEVKQIKKIKVLIPSIAYQKKVIKMLSVWDRAIESNENLLRLGLKQKLAVKHNCLDRYISFSGTRIEASLPTVWKLIEIKDVASDERHSFTGGPFGSDLKKSDYTKNGIRVIQLQNIGDGEFINAHCLHTSIEKADQLKVCNVYADEIIISKMGDPVARACLMPCNDERYLMSSDGIRLKVNEAGFNKYFVMESINSFYFRKQAIRRSLGSTRQRIGLDELRKLKFISPPLPLQNKLAHIFKLMSQERVYLLNKIELLKSQKRELMRKLLTGNIKENI